MDSSPNLNFKISIQIELNEVLYFNFNLLLFTPLHSTPHVKSTSFYSTPHVKFSWGWDSRERPYTGRQPTPGRKNAHTGREKAHISKKRRWGSQVKTTALLLDKFLSLFFRVKHIPGVEIISSFQCDALVTECSLRSPIWI